MTTPLIYKATVTIKVIPLALLLLYQFHPATAETTQEESDFVALVDAITKHYTIHHGGFREFRTGQTRADAFEALSQMNIPSISFRLDPRPLANAPEDVELLQNAEAIVVDSFLFAEFEGDEVGRIGVIPVKLRGTYNEQQLRSQLNSRSDVLNFLRKYLTDFPGSEAYASPKQPWHISVTGLPASKRIIRYPGWSFNLTDGEGWWHVILWFEGDVLNEIEVSFSPVELP